MADASLENTTSKFRCRKCGMHLFSFDHLESHAGFDVIEEKRNQKVDRGSEVNISSFEKCSSWFLKDEKVLPWVTESVEEAQWTEGKIYCPKCRGRIGAFDFIHRIQCNCGKFTIPSIWVQKSRVDHICPKSHLKNLDIRKPVHAVISLWNNSGNSPKESNQVTDLSNSNVGADISCSQNMCSQHTKAKYEEQDMTLHSSLQCEQLSDVKYSFEVRALVTNSRNQSCQRLPTDCSNMCRLRSYQTGELNNSSRGAVNIKRTEGGISSYKYKRIRKESHQISSLPDADEVEGSTDTQTFHFSEESNRFSCLPVDGGIDETTTTKHKVVIPEIQDHHCCAVCLDLLFEPLKCSCDHVFCDPCLRQLNFQTGKRGTIRCPLCRQTVKHLSPASELRNEIRNTYDPHTLRKREKAERRAPYRKWPLPSSHGPSRRTTYATQRSVTLRGILVAFLCACLYSLVVILVLPSVADGIKIY